MFGALKDVSKRFKKLTLKSVYKELFNDREFRELIVRLNTEGEQSSQLIYGVNSKGENLSDVGGEYSDITMMLAAEQGRPKLAKDIVNLKDTGEFYRSFKTYWVNSDEGAIQISAQTFIHDTDLIADWGRDIIGLDEYNIGVLREYARNKVGKIVRSKLGL